MEKIFICVGIVSMFLLTSFTVSANVFEINHNISLDSINIILDCNQTNGVIKSYSEVNCGPLKGPNLIFGADLTNQYQKIGISFVRPHGVSGPFPDPTDISAIFPDFSADPTLESSYNFKASDKYIAGIIKAGCKVFYRLGETGSIFKSMRTPPKDMNKWAEICKHITMHYNDGWNNGYHYNITYWEVWNEPDLPIFWTGTANDYYQLYNITARTLKAYNSSLKVGGPCIYTITNTDKNYTEGFLKYLDDNDLPLDFFSWHHYPITPNQMYTDSIVLLDLLDRYGFTNCENIISEWNNVHYIPQRERDNAKNAAFTACSLTTFQYANIEYAFRYRGNTWSAPVRLWQLFGEDWSLFTKYGQFKTPTLVYLAMHYITRDTPIRLTTPIMDASSGITYLAGISEDNANISILISNYNADDTSYNLELTNLTWNTPYTVVHYLIDDKHHLEISKQEIKSGTSCTITQTLKNNTVHFIRLTNTSFIPDEGPRTARIPFILRLKVLDSLQSNLSKLFMLFWNMF